MKSNLNYNQWSPNAFPKVVPREPGGAALAEILVDSGVDIERILRICQHRNRITSLSLVTPPY